MELNGAFSNPFVSDKSLLRLTDLHGQLLDRAATTPTRPRSARPKPSPVLESITLVLQEAEQPMRAREIHTPTKALAVEPVLWTPVKAALAAGASARSRRFRRVRHGVYELAGQAAGAHRPAEERADRR